MWYFPNISLLQMPSRTRAHDGAGTSRGQEDTPNPPRVPPTLAEAITALVTAIADNTRFLREMAGQLQQQGGKAYLQGPRETSYLDFSETRPPLFFKAEDPLEADEWVRVIEQKFGLIRSTETQKPLFVAQQLRGPASTWWGNYVATQPAGHQVTWDEFKLAFCEHYIPEGVLHMKQEEFMKLKQGGDTVMQFSINSIICPSTQLTRSTLTWKRGIVLWHALTTGYNGRWPLASISPTAGLSAQRWQLKLSMQARQIKGNWWWQVQPGAWKATKVGDPTFQSKPFFTSSTLLPLQTTCIHLPCHCPHLNNSAECPWCSFPRTPELINWLLQLWEVWTFHQRLPISEAEQLQ
jgi:hypothetical protein